MKCCFCGRDAGRWGNNALPIMDAKCCDRCNLEFVVPIRILRMNKRIKMVEKMKEEEK